MSRNLDIMIIFNVIARIEHLINMVKHKQTKNSQFRLHRLRVLNDMLIDAHDTRRTLC